MRYLLILIVLLLSACETTINGVRITDRLEPNFSRDWGEKPQAEDCHKFGLKNQNRKPET